MLSFRRMKRRPVVRRRRDGIVEIRPRRLRDAFRGFDANFPAVMLGSFGAMLVTIYAALISPILVAIAGFFVAIGVWGGWLARSTRRAPAPALPPPRRAA